MKKLLLSTTLALGLAAIVPTLAWAQSDDHPDRDKPHAMAGQGDENKGPDADAGKDKKAHDDKAVKPDHAMGTGNAMTGAEKNKMNADKHGRTDTTMRTDRDTRTTHNKKVDVTTYRKTVTATRHFHIGVYHAPHGYSYRRYNTGDRLDAQFYARDYWLNDFSAYDLIAPPDGYVWVRFGPDALLVDEDDGEVLQVVYGVFA
ncbi:MAG TPA: RcnB family protein [Rhizomicrobium sp.]|jgi:Ni/Co efflux regulator RcnB|nr:RcnB family protein [Rhizomicrobium sp.]